jgi:hypothetical protein
VCGRVISLGSARSKLPESACYRRARRVTDQKIRSDRKKSFERAVEQFRKITLEAGTDSRN